MQSGEFLCKWLGSTWDPVSGPGEHQDRPNKTMRRGSHHLQQFATIKLSIWWRDMDDHNCQPESREKCWQLGVRRFILTLNTSSRHTRRNTWRICSSGPRQDVEINTSQCWHLQALYTLSPAQSQCRRKCSSSLNQIGSTPSNWSPFFPKINTSGGCRKWMTDVFLTCWLYLIMNFLLLCRHDGLIRKLTAAKKWQEELRSVTNGPRYRQQPVGIVNTKAPWCLHPNRRVISPVFTFPTEMIYENYKNSKLIVTMRGDTN